MFSEVKELKKYFKSRVCNVMKVENEQKTKASARNRDKCMPQWLYMIGNKLTNICN